MNTSCLSSSLRLGALYWLNKTASDNFSGIVKDVTKASLNKSVVIRKCIHLPDKDSLQQNQQREKSSEEFDEEDYKLFDSFKEPWDCSEQIQQDSTAATSNIILFALDSCPATKVLDNNEVGVRCWFRCALRMFDFLKIIVPNLKVMFTDFTHYNSNPGLKKCKKKKTLVLLKNSLCKIFDRESGSDFFNKFFGRITRECEMFVKRSENAFTKGLTRDVCECCCCSSHRAAAAASSQEDLAKTHHKINWMNYFKQNGVKNPNSNIVIMCFEEVENTISQHDENTRDYFEPFSHNMFPTCTF